MGRLSGMCINSHGVPEFSVCGSLWSRYGGRAVLGRWYYCRTHCIRRYVHVYMCFGGVAWLLSYGSVVGGLDELEY